METFDEQVDEWIEHEIFVRCKDYGFKRDDFNSDHIKGLLAYRLVKEVMEEEHPLDSNGGHGG